MYRVVIADDEVLIRMYIREILENNGYEVVGEAEDGLDAIAVCRQKKPDFVIMDINMPVMTGLEATKVINEDKLAGFVIILTAYRDKEITDQAVNTDVMGYIVKPVDEDTLIPSVKIAIHNYNQREIMAKEFHKTQEALDDRKIWPRIPSSWSYHRSFNDNVTFFDLFKHIIRQTLQSGCSVFNSHTFNLTQFYFSRSDLFRDQCFDHPDCLLHDNGANAVSWKNTYNDLIQL